MTRRRLDGCVAYMLELALYPIGSVGVRGVATLLPP